MNYKLSIKIKKAIDEFEEICDNLLKKQETSKEEIKKAKEKIKNAISLLSKIAQ